MKVQFSLLFFFIALTTYGHTTQDSSKNNRYRYFMGIYPSALFTPEVQGIELAGGLKSHNGLISNIYISLGAQNKSLSKDVKQSLPAYNHETIGYYLTAGVDFKIAESRKWKFKAGPYIAQGKNIRNQFVYNFSNNRMYRLTDKSFAIGAKVGVSYKICKRLEIETGVRMPVQIWTKTDVFEDPNIFTFRNERLYPFRKIADASWNDLWYFIISI